MRGARITKLCRQCAAPFSIPPCRDWREHYCSSTCRKAYDAARAAELDRVCPVCGCAFKNRRNIEIRTCSPQCAGILAVGRQQNETWKNNRLKSWTANGNAQKAKKGPLNPRFTGRKMSEGYVWVWTEKTGYIQEHRLVMQRHLGRPLTDDEIVHHHNRDRTDNRLENLQVMTREEHSAEHLEERIKARKLVRSKKCKLHIDQVAVIRNKLAAGASSKALAQEFGVTETTVSHIRNRVTWSHVA
jgi:Zn-finger nucleic acid-binding protein